MAEKESKEVEYQAVQVPTEHRIMIQNPKGEVMTMEEVLAEISNKLDKLLKVM